MHNTESSKTPESIGFGDKAKQDYRQMCKYGKGCYQKNPMHHQKFRHPSSDPPPNDLKKRQLDEKDFESESSPSKVLKPAEDCNKDDNLAKNKDTEGESEDLITPSGGNNETIEDSGPTLSPQDGWPKDKNENLEEKFLVKMPPDFFTFWGFCTLMNRSNPLRAIFDTAGLKLVGPFELLLEAKVEFKTLKLNDFLCHWRYYYDPPEFQTVLASESSNFHIGYFRDSPNDLKPAFVASSTGDDCRLTPLGDNLFGAVYNYLGSLSLRSDPFKQAAIQKLRQSIHSHAVMKNQDESYSLDSKTQSMKNRDKIRVCSTFHGAGMAVPYNKATEVGYRPIPETPANLKKIFAKIVSTEAADKETKDKAFDALQELITNVQFANDEGDFGMGLELGLNAFLYGGKPLEPSAKHLMGVAYNLLDRENFGKILNAHLDRRETVFKAR